MPPGPAQSTEPAAEEPGERGGVPAAEVVDAGRAQLAPHRRPDGPRLLGYVDEAQAAALGVGL
jgi:hypothetical protein